MDFGDVVRGLKQGKMFARTGWNGKGMYIYLTRGEKATAESWVPELPGQELTWKEVENDEVVTSAHIDMMNARGVRVIGWLASQEDMLADDWYEARQE